MNSLNAFIFITKFYKYTLIIILLTKDFESQAFLRKQLWCQFKFFQPNLYIGVFHSIQILIYSVDVSQSINDAFLIFSFSVILSSRRVQAWSHDMNTDSYWWRQITWPEYLPQGSLGVAPWWSPSDESQVLCAGTCEPPPVDWTPTCRNIDIILLIRHFIVQCKKNHELKKGTVKLQVGHP